MCEIGDIGVSRDGDAAEVALLSGPPPAPVGRPARRKLWEIDAGWHCVILGSCIGMPELRALATKLGVTARNRAGLGGDYDIHSTMVYWASRDRRIGKALHKFLDRKFALAVARLAKIAEVDGLAAAWAEAVARGEVAGTLWAVMSHPAATTDLQTAVFGEMHMLSHQVGSASRADLRRLRDLEAEKAALENRLAAERLKHRDGLAARDATIRDLRAGQEREREERTRAAAGEAGLERMRTALADLRRRAEEDGAARQVAEERWRRLEERQAGLEAESARLRDEAATLRAENAALEARLAQSLEPPAEQVARGGGRKREAACDQACERPDLCGRCILYVGGRNQQVPHFRRIVEECNGVFVHHDGGFEDGMGRLSRLLGQADTVMFPIDCVSHMAHDHLKRLCKRWEKPFLPVRGSGLGAFMRALETVRGENAGA